MIITYVSMTAMVLFIFSLLPFILNAYNLSDLTAKTTADIIHFHGIGAIFIWPVAFSLPATFRAAGDAKACMYISSISMWIFRIGFSYVLGKYMGIRYLGCDGDRLGIPGNVFRDPVFQRKLEEKCDCIG